jgi:putative transposase
VCEWATWNGRIRGMKLHVVYDPRADVPRCIEITPACLYVCRSALHVR